MASRPRSRKKRGWPQGLYERGGYFSWMNPLTGVEMGIGRVSEGEAKAQASEANIEVQGLRNKPRLIDRLQGKSDTSWRAWLVVYEKKLGLQLKREPGDPEPTRELAKNTRSVYRAQVKLIRETYAASLDLPIERVTTKIVADGLDLVKKTRARTAQAMRSRLLDSFDGAIAAGWTTTNPVTVTEDVVVKVKRARLTWEVFQQLYARMQPGRLKNGTALALVSGQARETVVAGTFSEIGMVDRPGLDPVECWRVTRGKTKAMIAIPLDLRLNVFGMSLRDVVKQCRSTSVASKYLVHNTERVKAGRIGGPVALDQLTKDFTEAVTALGIDWGDKTPPTFHELRSLSKRLYDTQGGVNTKDLLGHSTAQTAALYADGRGVEYKLVSLG